MNQQTDPESNQTRSKSSIGNSKLGAKSYVFLGFFLSTAINIGGLAKLVDSLIEWTGIMKRILDIYQDVIVLSIDKIVTALLSVLYIKIDLSEAFLAYTSLCFSTAAMYMFSVKLVSMFTDQDLKPKGALPLFEVFKMFFWEEKSLSSILFQAELRHDVKPIVRFFSIPIKVLFLLIIAVPILIIAFLSNIFLFPFVIFLGTLVSINTFFRHDFNAIASNEQENKKFNSIRELYNTTVIFWCCVLGTVIATGLLIKLNDVIADRCQSSDMIEVSLICKS